MRELVLYIARGQEDDHAFGRVKLAKLLYFADFEAYVRLGSAITGATYQKLPEGPAAREFVPLRDQLIAYGEAREVSMRWPNGRVSRQLLANRNPDTSVFSAEELAVVDETLERFRGINGTAISQVAHREMGWRVVPMNEVIPYQSYFVAPAPTDEQMQRAAEVAEKLGLFEDVA